MIPWPEVVAGVVMGFFGSVPVAGPVALVVITKGLSRDHPGARAVGLGAGLAEGLLASAIFAGMGWIVAASPEIAAGLDWAGAFALLCVGAWFAFRGLDSPETMEGDDEDGERSSLRSVLFGAGMVAGNPGMIGTWGGAITGLEGTGLIASSADSAPAFGLGVAVGVTSWFWMLIAAIKRWSGLLSGRLLGLLVRGIGVALILMASFASFRLISN